MTQRRSALFVDKRFQIFFALYVCSWLLVLSLVYPLIIHNVFNLFIRSSSQGISPAEVLSRARDKVFWLLLAIQIAFLGGAFLTSIFVSHRIIGPLKKIQNLLTAGAQGDFSEPAKLRKEDHFQDLGDAFNEFRNSTHARLENVDAAIVALEKAVLFAGVEARVEIEYAIKSLKESQKK